MRALLAAIVAGLVVWTPPAGAWGADTISAGEVDVHSIFYCDLLWSWTVTFTLLDPQPGDTVAVSLESTDGPTASPQLATWLQPVVTFRGWGNMCALLVEVAGLTVVGQRAYTLGITLAYGQDQ